MCSRALPRLDLLLTSDVLILIEYTSIAPAAPPSSADFLILRASGNLVTRKLGAVTGARRFGIYDSQPSTRRVPLSIPVTRDPRRNPEKMCLPARERPLFARGPLGTWDQVENADRSALFLDEGRTLGRIRGSSFA